jgi:pimeloyl-ACP methyl ester carboxylesterase
VGKGSPTVLLEAGANRTSEDYRAVQRATAKLTRVCSYDRAGLGRSEVGPLPRSGLADARDLKKLLDAASIEGPYVFVGHSYGALVARIFTGEFRKVIFGVVLVDSPHEDYPRPNAQHRQRRPIDWQTTMDQARAVGSLGDLPLVVLTAGKVPPPTPEDDEPLWWRLQAQLAALSPRGRQVLLPECDHMIPTCKPDAIVSAIRSMLPRVCCAAFRPIDSPSPAPRLQRRRRSSTRPMPRT